jgi:hypothetical protein
LTFVYAGVATALLTLVCSFPFSAQIPILYIPLILLIGVGPVLGYQLAYSQFGRDWKPIIGGILGMILVPIFFVLWPVLVGALSKDQSIWRLLLGSIIGFVLFLIVFFVLGNLIGQDPAWVQWGAVAAFGVWGGACGTAMAAWRKE